MSIIAGAVCDLCGDNKIYKHIGKTYITKWIREEGWSVTRKNGKETVLCPICKHKNKKYTKVILK